MKNTAGKPWFPYVKPRPAARVRLFCLPYAGGSAAIFRKWPDLLPPFIEVFPIEIPGRGSRLREKPFTSVKALVDAVEGAICSYLEKPFALFGHSMGALISFELTHKLFAAQAVQPVQLFCSGRRAPEIVHHGPPTFNLPHHEFVEELRRLEGTPAEVLAHPELLEMLEPTLRADFEIVDTYRYAPRPALACPITVFGGIADIETTREHLEAWRKYTSGPFSLHMFPGNHFFLQPQERLVLQIIAKVLAHWEAPG